MTVDRQEAVEPGSPAPETLSRKGQRTRSQLLNAAETVFSNVGFHTARVQDIAMEAGVSHGTFYTYFDSKEAIFRTLIQSLSDQLMDRGTVVKGDPVASVLVGLRMYVDAYSRSRDMMMQFEHMAMVDPEVHALLRLERDIAIERAERSLSRLHQGGHVSEPRDAFHTARALVAMVGRMCFEWFAFDEDLDRDAVIRALTEAWLRTAGMAPETVDAQIERLLGPA